MNILSPHSFDFPVRIIQMDVENKIKLSPLPSTLPQGESRNKKNTQKSKFQLSSSTSTIEYKIR